LSSLMTLEDDSFIYGLDYQARALASRINDCDKTEFLIGTQSLRLDNQIALLEFDEDNGQVSKRSYNHPAGEIWHISSCPNNKDLVTTCYVSVKDNKCKPGCTIWSLASNDTSAADAPNISEISSANLTEFSSVSCFQWQPTTSCSSGILVADNSVLLLDTNSNLTVQSKWSFDGKAAQKLTTGKWNPHHKCQTVGVAVENQIKGFDIRSKESIFSIENAHIPVVRDIDFNPNRQYILASAGDDCKVKFWDCRSTSQPLVVLAEHSHWVWNVRYNPVHDQLVLTCSSDARSILHSIQSISSDVVTGMREIEAEDGKCADTNSISSEKDLLDDGVVKMFEENEESVYCVEWSANDPWVFASLSYDGRVTINKVPRAVKYKILQL